SGKVQGVYFRDTAKRRAIKFGISGFARNQPDGTVYIEAEGDDDAVAQYIAWCHEGSRQAVVEDVAVTEHQPVGHQGFRIG
ncbi:MAG: acylphosphatase, partial [Candidatus Saccharibacteria bacterium]|nr:acylphosphatase [Candidatus Saccharibacteria bacterium]